MPESDPRFAKAVFAVEATSAEQQFLWQENSNTSRDLRPQEGAMLRGAPLRNPDGVKWEQDNPGQLRTVGTFGGMPVCVSCSWVKINGHLVLFYHPTSMVVHHKMIEEWLLKRCAPRWDNGTRSAYCDAQNFHHVIHTVKKP